MIPEISHHQAERKGVRSMLKHGLSVSAVDPDRGTVSGRTAVSRARSLAMVVGLLMSIAGCSTSPGTMSEAEPAGASEVEGVRAVPAQASHQDEFYDPFAQPDETEEADDNDPWESFNTVMFEFNRKVDKYALKPVAQAYNFVLPNVVQVGVSNFFHNVRFVPRLVNNVFQMKAKGAGIELGRFLINSTVGVGGFFDPAKHWWHLETPDEDTGQTLGAYGMKQGPYLVLPLFPPLTVRDGIGYVADLALDPINWLVFPVIEVNDMPSAVAHKNRTTSTIAQLGTRVGGLVNDRSLNLEKFQGVEEATLDLYTAVRNAYLQKRAKAVRE